MKRFEKLRGIHTTMFVELDRKGPVVVVRTGQITERKFHLGAADGAREDYERRIADLLARGYVTDAEARAAERRSKRIAKRMLG